MPSEQLFIWNSYFFKAVSSQHLFFHNSSFLSVKVLPSSYLLRTGSSFEQLLFQNGWFFGEQICSEQRYIHKNFFFEAGTSTQHSVFQSNYFLTAASLKEILFKKGYFSRTATFRKKLVFQKRGSKYFLWRITFQKGHFFRATSFSKQLIFQRSFLFV